MSFIPKPHEIYRHFKGNLYQIVTIAEHSETGEQLVIYQALYGEYKTYARPLAMFTQRVDRTKYPDVQQEFRFALQGEDSARQSAATEPAADIEPETDTEAKADTEPAADTEQEADTRPTVDTEPEEVQLDPMVLQFLEADTYEERLNILAGLQHRITDDMITTMAIACDVEVEEGDTQSRYDSLRKCLRTLEKFECNRLR